MDRDELLRELRDSGSRAAARLRAVPPGLWNEGRYENGWNARQILAHLAAVEWTYPRLLDPAPPGEPATREARGGFDAYNARQVGRRDAVAVADLIAEFEANRATTIAAVEAATPADLARPARSAGGASGTLADVLHAVAVRHVLEHVADITGAGRG